MEHLRLKHLETKVAPENCWLGIRWLPFGMGLYIYIYLVFGSVFFFWFVTCNKFKERHLPRCTRYPSRRAVSLRSLIFLDFSRSVKEPHVAGADTCGGVEGDDDTGRYEPQVAKINWKMDVWWIQMVNNDETTTGRLGSIKVANLIKSGRVWLKKEEFDM